MSRTTRWITASLVLAGALLATGCSSTVALKPAPDANNPLCADIMVRLPDGISDQDRRWTDAQATAAWGDPTYSVLMSCGVEVPGPSTMQCVTLGGTDWLVDPADTPWMRMTSYGREPAVQLYVNNEVISPDTVLEAIGPRMSSIPVTAKCTAPDVPIDEGGDGA